MYVHSRSRSRAELDLEKRYADQGGMSAVVIRLRLPDGTMYDQTARSTMSSQACRPRTDTILLRGKIANPPLKPIEAGKPVDRPLIDGEFVTVLVEGIAAGAWHLAIPRAAVLSDQQGNYVYVVDGDNKVEQRRIQLGQSTPIHGGDHGRPQRRRHGRRWRASSACGRHPGDTRTRRTDANARPSAAGQ